MKSISTPVAASIIAVVVIAIGFLVWRRSTPQSPSNAPQGAGTQGAGGSMKMDKQAQMDMMRKTLQKSRQR